MSVSTNVAEVLEQIGKAAEACGRKPEEVTLVAATKTQSADVIREVILAGVTVCGENRVQEMAVNQGLAAYEGADLHFIGHLQTNKVRQVVGQVSLLQSVGSRHLLVAVSDFAVKKDLVQDILLEVNVSKEASKSGFFVEDLDEIADFIQEHPGVRLRGLMAIPPRMEDACVQSKIFERLYKLYEDLPGRMSQNGKVIDCLSMGMSDDYTLAIQQGSTMVRVGTALFGARLV